MPVDLTEMENENDFANQSYVAKNDAAKRRCKNDVKKWRSSEPIATLFEDGITSTTNPLILFLTIFFKKKVCLNLIGTLKMFPVTEMQILKM